MTDFAHRLAEVRARIERAAATAGRNPGTIELLPITKTLASDRLHTAIEAGLTRFGENRVKELVSKAGELRDCGVEWVQVGHLQTNKAAEVARHAAEFQALDSVRVAARLDRELATVDRTMPVYVQVNTSGEASKFGVAPDDALAFVRGLEAFAQLRPTGFMTLAIHADDADAIRSCFAKLRHLRDEACLTIDANLNGLSMGMSGDFEIAIEEGATCIRVGQALFGARELPDSHFWPDGSGLPTRSHKPISTPTGLSAAT